MIIINGLSFEDFGKKYGFAINNLSLRMGYKTNDILSKKLYEESLAGRLNINELNLVVHQFYSGSVASQIQINDFINKYKNV